MVQGRELRTGNRGPVLDPGVVHPIEDVYVASLRNADAHFSARVRHIGILGCGRLRQVVAHSNANRRIGCSQVSDASGPPTQGLNPGSRRVDVP